MDLSLLLEYVSYTVNILQPLYIILILGNREKHIREKNPIYVNNLVETLNITVVCIFKKKSFSSFHQSLKEVNYIPSSPSVMVKTNNCVCGLYFENLGMGNEVC